MTIILYPARVFFRLENGAAYHLSPSVVLQHQVQQAEGGPPAWRQAGLPVPEEAPLCAQVSDDRRLAEGCEACHVSFVVHSVPVLLVVGADIVEIQSDRRVRRLNVHILG